jgi:hypothetical protein
VRLFHTLRATSAVFDDPNLVSTGGLLPVVALAESAGLHGLADDVAAGIAPPVAAANGYSLAIVICAVLLAIGGLLSLLLMENFKPEPPPGVGSSKGEGESGAEPDAETPVLGAART